MVSSHWGHFKVIQERVPLVPSTQARRLRPCRARNEPSQLFASNFVFLENVLCTTSARSASALGAMGPKGPFGPFGGISRLVGHEVSWNAGLRGLTTETVKPGLPSPNPSF